MLRVGDKVIVIGNTSKSNRSYIYHNIPLGTIGRVTAIQNTYPASVILQVEESMGTILYADHVCRTDVKTNREAKRLLEDDY